MQDGKLTSDLIKIAKEKLSSGAVQSVVGWKKGLFDYDITPAVFKTDADFENFVYNENCGANLSKYLVKITRAIETAKSTTRVNNAMAKQRDPNAQDKPIPQEKVLVFLKPCDTYSFTQLLKESRIARDDVFVVGVPCDGMKDPDYGDLAERCADGFAACARDTCRILECADDSQQRSRLFHAHDERARFQRLRRHGLGAGFLR